MIKKYRLTSDRYGAHQKIINWVGRKKRVLEIGCANGYLLKKLTANGCQCLGIEVDPKMASLARKNGLAVITGDIEGTSMFKKIGHRRFEIIVLADVLEHLKDPEVTFKKLACLLEKEGRIIISVPNISFLTYRLLHLLGKFDYTDWGIMDRTHLRFFTRNSIIQLVKGVGLKIEKEDFTANFTQLPLYMQTLYPLVGEKRWWRGLERKITGFWPEGLAVQFLLICRKK